MLLVTLGRETRYCWLPLVLVCAFAGLLDERSVVLWMDYYHPPGRPGACADEWFLWANVFAVDHLFAELTYVISSLMGELAHRMCCGIVKLLSPVFLLPSVYRLPLV